MSSTAFAQYGEVGFGEHGVPAGPRALSEQSADPSVVPNIGWLYSKDTSGISELFYEDDTSNVIQLTSGGYILPSENIVDKTVAAETIYVATTGTDVATCGTEASPCLTIQYAIDLVPEVLAHNVTIDIAAGTYAEALDISKVSRSDGSTYLKLVGKYTELLGEQTVTSSSSTTVTVSGATWTVNEFQNDIFLITGGGGFSATGTDIVNVAVVKSNTADTLTFVDIYSGINNTTTFKIITPSVILNSAGNSYGLTLNSNNTVAVITKFFKFQGATVSAFYNNTGEALIVGCDFDASAGGFYGVLAYADTSIYGSYIHGTYSATGFYSNLSASRIQYSTVDGVTGNGDRGLRASGGWITAKSVLINNCNEGAKADGAGVIDFADSEVSNCANRAFRADAFGYIEAYDVVGSGNGTVIISFAAGTGWIDTSKITGTTLFDVQGSGRVQDSADGTMHYSEWTTNDTTVQTTDTTTTQIAAIALDEGDYVRVEADVSCRQDDGTDHAFYQLAGLFYRNTSGDVTQVGATTSLVNIESDAGLNATFTADTTNQTVDINVIGLGASTFDWSSTYKYKKIAD